ncbi:transporter substrate-binding domain-containing protein [Pseudomonas taiwanensis]|uniref:transporter substrate-binding domain-containing protein n=1 Tax=Pseudomonas taiwanensis TaxID=470150 RepID=UPI00164673C3|nr:transporter substrate-binding domain-containing protein [Pseudomonas taiwanensis]MBC3489673.1 transporter substrate-binding domain-containing protein [Pseudomonas taiwanensis]
MKRSLKATGWCLASLLLCAVADSTVAAADVLSRLRQGQVLNLGFVEGFAPFSSRSEQAPEGYSIDLCQAVVARLRESPGLAGLQVRWRSLAEPEAVRTVGDGQVDLLCTPMVETLSRRGTLDFSIAVFTSGLAALVRRDAPNTLLGPLSGGAQDTSPRWRATINAGLSKHSFAVLRGTLSSRWAHERIRQLGLQSTLQEVSTYAEGVQRVVDRKVDALLGDRVVLLAYQARQAERDQLWVPDHLFVMSRVALSMPRGDDDFRLLVDTALSQALSGPQGEALFVRHLGPLSAQDRLLQSLYPLPD